MASIYPSLISSDLLNLQRTIEMLDPYCSGYHIDIMDNHFVPNLTWGPQFVNAIAQATSKKLWVHVMADNPETLISNCLLRPDDIVSFHIETKSKKQDIIQGIKEKKCKVSIAINPKTAVSEVLPYLDVIDQLLIMSVNPGFSGQSFIPSVLDKLKQVSTYRTDKNLSYTIAMDGGITESNIAQLISLGVDDVAIASGIFGHSNPIEHLKKLQTLANKK